jgi:hypothetical protein
MTKSLLTYTKITFFGKITLFLFKAISIIEPTKSKDKSIILGRPTDDSITTSVLFEVQTDYYLEYGTVSGINPISTSVFINTSQRPYEIELINLIPNTQYFYRLVYENFGSANYNTTLEYNFQIQRSSGSSFTFTIEVDEHFYDKKGIVSMYQVNLANEAKERPDFTLYLGDILGYDYISSITTSGDMDALYKDYRHYLGQIYHSIPLYVCLGNQKAENDNYFNQNPPFNIGVLGNQRRKCYYLNPFQIISIFNLLITCIIILPSLDFYLLVIF